MAKSSKDKNQAGVIYTPPSIATLLAKQALSRIQSQKGSIKVLDPAAGEGALLKALAEIWSASGRKFSRLSLFGIDLNSSPLKKLGIEFQRSKIKKQLIRGDFLRLDEAPEIKNRIGSGFDLILLNPPYIGEKGNKQLFDAIKETALGRRFYEGKMDLSYFFMEQSIQLLKPNGILAALTPTYWMTSSGGNKLRAEIREKCDIVDMLFFGDQRIFPDALGQHNMITLFQRKLRSHKPKICKVVRFVKDLNLSKADHFEVKSQAALYLKDGQVAATPQVDQKFLDRLEQDAKFTLGQIASIDCGVQSGADRLTAAHLQRFPKIDAKVGDGIFVLSAAEAESLKLSKRERRLLKPFFKNSDITPGVVDKKNEKLLLYITKRTKITHYPRIQAHLSKFRPILEQRRECQSGALPWYALHWARDERIFHGAKIVTAQRAKQPCFAVSKRSFFASVDVYFIRPYDSKIDIQLLTEYLNSKHAEKWLRRRGKVKGSYLELYAEPLSKLPVLGDFSQKLKESRSSDAEH